jgi:hypothetical protein
MKPEEIAAIKALADAATEGPWLTPKEAGGPYNVEVIDHEGCLVWPWGREEDMVFAYAAREAVPALLKHIEELELINARLANTGR